MIIGINATAAFIQPRTGVEEYTYQLIKHLAMLEQNKEHRFILYTPNKGRFDFQLPDNFKLAQLNWPGPMWTQIRLAREMLINRPEMLFIPVHVLPLIHPQNSVVAIHGLEYEYYPEMYPKKSLTYLRWSTKYALKKASKIIAISENTKKDLVELYNGDPEKIQVVHHGFYLESAENQVFRANSNPYILFIGRLETRKNVQGLIRAFNLLKKKYQVPHQLILVGSRGYDYQKIKLSPDIIEKGYVSPEEKQSLLKNAEMYVLPSFYEGFGMPILEAQISGCPVITSNVSSMPEVAGQGALLVDPKNIEQICQMMYKVIDDRELRGRLIKQGYENIKRFSWQKCASETLKVLEVVP